MDAWDMIIMSIGGYVAVVSLVRLMARRRNELIDEVRMQVKQSLESSGRSGAEDDD